jgi:hypothetical protein
LGKEASPATFGERFHHFPGLVVLFQETVHVGNSCPAAASDAFSATRVENEVILTFLVRH